VRTLALWLLCLSSAHAYEVNLTWTPPTQNSDGTPLTDLAGYRIFHGCTESGEYDTTTEIGVVTSHAVTDLEGTCYFTATAFNAQGIESDFSNEAVVGEAPGVPVVRIEWRGELMAVAHVQTKGTDFEATPEVVLDAGPTEGNLLLAYSHHRSGAADASISGTGWTKVLERDIEVADATFRRALAVFAKFAGAAETGTISISWSGGPSSQMQVREFSGVEGEDIVSASNDNGATDDETSVGTGTTAAIDDNVLNVAFFGIKRDGVNPRTALGFNFGVGWDTAAVNDDGAQHSMVLASSWIDVADAGGSGQTTTVSFTADQFDNNNGLHAAIVSIPVAAAGGGNDIAATGAQSFGSSADLNATGTLAATGAMAFADSADLNAVGELAATGSMAWTSSADLDATGTLAATGALAFTESASLNATGTLDATGAITWTSSADLTSGVDNELSAVGALSFGSSADLSAVGELAATGALSFGSSADLDALGTLQATGALAFVSSADLTGLLANDLAATGAIAFTGTADLDAIGVLAGTGAVSWGSSANLTDANAVVPYENTITVMASDGRSIGVSGITIHIGPAN
jgi:hypothetical protein